MTGKKDAYLRVFILKSKQNSFIYIYIYNINLIMLLRLFSCNNLTLIYNMHKINLIL